MATAVYISFTAAITRSREKPRMATIRASELLDQVLDAPAQLVGGGLLAGRAQRFLQLQLELGAAEAAAAVFEVPAHRRRDRGRGTRAGAAAPPRSPSCARAGSRLDLCVLRQAEQPGARRGALRLADDGGRNASQGDGRHHVR